MLRLAIRYHLRSQGPQVTVEESQLLENKRNRLQKLIDMFERQADAFLFNHEPTNDAPVMSMGDYAEYDDVDDIDDSGNPPPVATDPSGRHRGVRISDGSGMEDCNAEDIPLFLPSSLGWEWCSRHGLESLARKEAALRYAQVNDAIHRICLALGFKSALFRTQVRNARTQKTKTRAWTAIHTVDTMVHEHVRNYSTARDAHIKVQDPSESSPDLPPLLRTDLRVTTTVLGAAQVGQRNKQRPWIWGFGSSKRRDGTWMDECKSSPLKKCMINAYKGG